MNKYRSVLKPIRYERKLKGIFLLLVQSTYQINVRNKLNLIYVLNKLYLVSIREQ